MVDFVDDVSKVVLVVGSLSLSEEERGQRLSSADNVGRIDVDVGLGSFGDIDAYIVG